MFLRRYERHKSGKPHTYWALCESYRTAQGSRQRVVAYLGELKRSERPGWAELGRHLTGGERGRRPQLSLFDPPAHDPPADDEPVLVRLSRVRLERTRDFGDGWLAWGLWRMLELDQVLERLLPQGKEDVSWATVAASRVIARLCESHAAAIRAALDGARLDDSTSGRGSQASPWPWRRGNIYSHAECRPPRKRTRHAPPVR